MPLAFFSWVFLPRPASIQKERGVQLTASHCCGQGMTASCELAAFYMRERHLHALLPLLLLLLFCREELTSYQRPW
jgi:hypothetical protein